MTHCVLLCVCILIIPPHAQLQNTVDATVSSCAILLTELADVKDELSHSDEPVAAQRARLALRTMEEQRAHAGSISDAHAEEARQQIRHLLTQSKIYLAKKSYDIVEPMLVKLETLAREQSNGKALIEVRVIAAAA